MLPTSRIRFFLAFLFTLAFVAIWIRNSGEPAGAQLMLLAQFLLLVLMIEQGSLIRSRYKSLTIGLVSIYAIGFIITIMHWPYGQPLAMLAIILFLLFYLFWFSKKTNKSLLDHLKVIWLSLQTLTFLNIHFKWFYRPPFIAAAALSFWILVFVFSYPYLFKTKK